MFPNKSYLHQMPHILPLVYWQHCSISFLMTIRSVILVVKSPAYCIRFSPAVILNLHIPIFFLWPKVHNNSFMSWFFVSCKHGFDFLVSHYKYVWFFPLWCPFCYRLVLNNLLPYQITLPSIFLSILDFSCHWLVPFIWLSRYGRTYHEWHFWAPKIDTLANRFAMKYVRSHTQAKWKNR